MMEALCAAFTRAVTWLCAVVTAAGAAVTYLWGRPDAVFWRAADGWAVTAREALIAGAVCTAVGLVVRWYTREVGVLIADDPELHRVRRRLLGNGRLFPD